MHVKIGWKNVKEMFVWLNKMCWPNNFAHFVEVGKIYNKLEYLI
jgi:hypothetical protein